MAAKSFTHFNILSFTHTHTHTHTHTQAPSPLPQTPSQKSQIQQILQNIGGKTEVHAYKRYTYIFTITSLIECKYNVIYVLYNVILCWYTCIIMLCYSSLFLCQALETTYRNLSSKLENFKVQYHEAFQLDSKCYIIEKCMSKI